MALLMLASAPLSTFFNIFIGKEKTIWKRIKSFWLFSAISLAFIYVPAFVIVASLIIIVTTLQLPWDSSGPPVNYIFNDHVVRISGIMLIVFLPILIMTEPILFYTIILGIILSAVIRLLFYPLGLIPQLILTIFTSLSCFKLLQNPRVWKKIGLPYGEKAYDTYKPLFDSTLRRIR